jgi:hypothetical protein
MDTNHSGRRSGYHRQAAVCSVVAPWAAWVVPLRVCFEVEDDTADWVLKRVGMRGDETKYIRRRKFKQVVRVAPECLRSTTLVFGHDSNSCQARHAM